ncbi:MAG: hypothetical protein RLW62_11430 [Gammaproteobacteria bacterium]
MNRQLAALLHDVLADRSYGYSIGGYGALAEFHDETAGAVHAADDVLTLASPRGALRLDTRRVTALRAWELLAAHPHGWQCGIGLLAPDARARGAGHRVLTELGPDRDAIDVAHRDHLLFDLGCGLAQADFLLRTHDSALIALLRAHAGTAVLSAGHAVLEALIDASPQRVVRSYAARIEVYQRIDRQRTPDGPHTHLLPTLLGRRRAHASGLPYPHDQLPVLTLHPENPLLDARGTPRPFAHAAWQRFEALLVRFGDAAYVAEKQRQVAAVRAGAAPQAYRAPRTRLGRLARRVALRQLAHTMPAALARQAWTERAR